MLHMVTYTLAPDRVVENEQLVSAVYAELELAAPEGLRYVTFGVHGTVNTGCAMVYFYARLAHAVVHIGGFDRLKARTVLFTVAWTAFVVFAIALLWFGRSGARP